MGPGPDPGAASIKNMQEDCPGRGGELKGQLPVKGVPFLPKWAYFNIPAVLISWLETSHGKHGFDSYKAMNFLTSSWATGQL